MGCEVQKTDTGVEIDVHRFDNVELARQYVLISRHYSYDQTFTWGLDGEIDLYHGPNPGERAAIRRDPRIANVWRASFWIEPGKALDGIRKMLPVLNTKELAKLIEEAADIYNTHKKRAGDTIIAVEHRRVIGK
jgi:hypothetical protein